MSIILIFLIICLPGEASFRDFHEFCHEEEINVFRCSLSRLNLDQIPRNLPRRTAYLDLSFNRISLLERNSFSHLPFLKTLLLNENKIINISNGTFINLTNLRTLNMSSTDLTEELLKDLVFALGKIPSLSNLLLHNNTYQTYDDVKFSSLYNVKLISLDVYNGFKFSDEFRSLKKLSTLSLFGRHHLMLHNDSFSSISTLPIQDLRLYFRDYIQRKVAINFLAPLSDLKRIKIRFGGFYTSIKDVLRSLHGLENKTIESLDVAFNYMNTAIAQELTKKDLEALSKICVTKLNLSFNDITKFRSSLFWNSKFGDCIESLDLKGNPFMQNNPYTALIFANMKSLKYLNIGIGSLHHRAGSLIFKNKAMETSRRHMVSSSLKRNKIVNITVHSSASMETLDMQGITIDILNFESTQIILSVKNMKSFNMRETDLDFCAFHLPVKFVGNGLLSLDMSGWACGNLNPAFFSGSEYFKFLKNLKASGCDFGRGFQNDRDGELLNNMSDLQDVDFSHNDLTTLHGSIFQHQRGSLKRIYLNNNRFDRIPTSVLKLQRIEYIDFRYNLLESLFAYEMEELTSKRNISIDLGGNVFSCTCENLPSLRWMLNNMEKINGLRKIPCKYSNIQLYTQLQSLRRMEINCLAQEWLPISMVLSLSITIAVFGTAIVYRYRYILRFYYLSWTKFSQLSKQPFHNGVFISYAYNQGEINKDSSWMIKHLYPFLTEVIKLNVFLDEKDFDVGISASDNIYNFMGKCSHIILVISRSFIQFKDAECHMDMAKMYSFHKKRSRIIVIFLDGMSREELPKSLSQVWFKIEFLFWPEKEGDAEKKAMFWKHLKTVLLE